MQEDAELLAPKLVSVSSFCVALLGSKIATPSTPLSLAEPAMAILENPSDAYGTLELLPKLPLGCVVVNVTLTPE